MDEPIRDEVMRRLLVIQNDTGVATATLLLAYRQVIREIEEQRGDGYRLPRDLLPDVLNLVRAKLRGGAH